MPSVNHESTNYQTNAEKKSPKRRLDRQRSERLIGNYTSDSRHQFSRQPSISEELPSTSNSNYRLDKQNNNNNHLTMVPEWLRKNPLQLHYVNNCERSKNSLKNNNQYEVHNNEKDDWTTPIRSKTGNTGFS